MSLKIPLIQVDKETEGEKKERGDIRLDVVVPMDILTQNFN